MKQAPPPNTSGSPGPRRPELTPAEVFEVLACLQARDRAKLSRLSAAGRLRKWGQ